MMVTIMIVMTMTMVKTAMINNSLAADDGDYNNGDVDDDGECDDDKDFSGR